MFEARHVCAPRPKGGDISMNPTASMIVAVSAWAGPHRGLAPTCALGVFA
jgi:hypothetical protein